MRQGLRVRVWRAALALGAVSLLGAGLLLVGVAEAQDTRNKPPADAAKPGPVENALGAVQQTAAVVEGTVQTLDPEFAEDTGPWTRVTLTGVVVHFGEAPAEKLSFVRRGGQYPDGRTLHLSHSPEFVRGAHYLVFLRNTSWNLTPVVGEYAFRFEKGEDGRELLIAPDGGVVVDFDADGPVVSAALFSPQDMNGSPPERLKEVPLPRQTLDSRTLLKSVQAFLAATGLKISGTFYDEPATRAKRLPVALKPGDPPGPDSEEPSQPDRELSQ
jgi:hypothetical protein